MAKHAGAKRVMLAVGVVFTMGAQGPCPLTSSEPPPQTVSRCDQDFQQYYGECGLELIDSDGQRVLQQDAASQCSVGFPASTRCFGLCTECNKCGDVPSCADTHCGAADIRRCADNLTYYYVTCARLLPSDSWSGTPLSQNDATQTCQDDTGLATCFNDCINNNAGRRACDDAANCIATVCWVGGMRGLGTTAVPQPCRSDKCRKICDALAGMDGTCPHATRSYNGCLQGCEALRETKSQCVDCIDTWFSPPGKSCDSLQTQIQGACANIDECRGYDFSWAQ